MSEFETKNESCAELDDLITQYVVGEIGSEDAQRVEAHLVECSDCRAEFEARKSAMGLIAGARLESAALESPRRESIVAAAQSPARPARTIPWLGSAAAALILFGVCAWFMELPGTDTGSREVARSTATGDENEAESLATNLGIENISQAAEPLHESQIGEAVVGDVAGVATNAKPVDVSVSRPQVQLPPEGKATSHTFFVEVDNLSAFNLPEVRMRATPEQQARFPAAHYREAVTKIHPKYRDGSARGELERAREFLGRHRRLEDLSQAELRLYSTLGESEKKEALLQAATTEGLDLQDLIVASPPPPIDGSVVAVRPDADLVILSVGGNDQVKEGYEFTLYRDTSFIAKARVIRVTEDMAGARILYTEGNESIEVGDKASTRIGGAGRAKAPTEPTPEPGPPTPEEILDARVQEILAALQPRPGETPDMMFFRYWGDNPFVLTRKDPLSTFALDVDTASYTLARNYLSRALLPPEEAIRTEEFVNYFPSNYPAPVDSALALHVHTAPSAFNRQANMHIVKVGVKAREVSDAERKATALTLVIDVSGSMKRERRLELVKEAIRTLLASLDERDSIGIVTFNTNASDVLQPTEADRIDTIMAAVTPLVADGSTNVQHGLELGYAMAARHYIPGGNNRVVLLSDGVANTGLTDAPSILGRIEEARKKGTFLNTFGVGMGNHNDALLEQLADKGDGQCAYIDSQEEANRLFTKNLSSLFETVAKDAKVQVEFHSDAVIAYRQIGYENRAVADADFRNDSVDAGEVSAGHEVVALYEVELREGATSKIATVRLRYQDVETDEVVEPIEQIVTPGDISRFENAPPRFRLSVCAAAFAEILRNSYWARETNLAELIERADSLLPLDHGDDRHVAELVALMRQASGLVAKRQPTEMARVIDELKRNRYLKERLREVIREREERELERLQQDNERLEKRIRALLRG